MIKLKFEMSNSEYCLNQCFLLMDINEARTNSDYFTFNVFLKMYDVTTR